MISKKLAILAVSVCTILPMVSVATLKIGIFRNLHLDLQHLLDQAQVARRQDKRQERTDPKLKQLEKRISDMVGKTRKFGFEDKRLRNDFQSEKNIVKIWGRLNKLEEKVLDTAFKQSVLDSANKKRAQKIDMAGLEKLPNLETQVTNMATKLKNMESTDKQLNQKVNQVAMAGRLYFWTLFLHFLRSLLHTSKCGV